MITQRVIVEVRNPVDRHSELLVGIDVTTDIKNGVMTSTCDWVDIFDKKGQNHDVSQFRLSDIQMVSNIEYLAVAKIRERMIVYYR